LPQNEGLDKWEVMIVRDSFFLLSPPFIVIRNFSNLQSLNSPWVGSFVDAGGKPSATDLCILIPLTNIALGIMKHSLNLVSSC
jgi:hypothetical protein